MPNQYKNKVIYGDQTLMDITDTTASSEDVLEGEIFYSANGARSVGTLGDATTSTHGLMSAADKTKLDGLDTALSNKADKNNIAITGSLSMGRLADSTIGPNSVAIGYNTTASGDYSHAIGYNTIASGGVSHAEGMSTTASGNFSHAEGSNTISSNQGSHSEGINTRATGVSSHAEGNTTQASNYVAHAEGGNTIASGAYSHAEGRGGTFTIDETEYTSGANGEASHTEGIECCATIDAAAAHAEGYQTIVSQYYSHAEGQRTVASGYSAHAEGDSTKAIGSSAHSEGYQTTASGYYSHSEGYETTASGYVSHAEGYETTASGRYSHAEGYNTTASGYYSHAEGDYNTVASGNASHAEGGGTQAIGMDSHAEGYYTIASGIAAHASGSYTIANQTNGFSLGFYNIQPTLFPAWVAGTSYNVGDKVTQYNNGYECITANTDSKWTYTNWKMLQFNSDVIFSIGNGVDNNNRSNACTIKTNGDAIYSGKITVGAAPTAAMDVATKGYVDNLPAATTSTSGLMSATDKTKLDGIDLLGVKLNTTTLTPDANGYVFIPLMTGATSSADGAAGLVPAPTSADHEKFFRGDGTWQDGGRPMVILSYGKSTWNDFIEAYNNNVIVYCRASSNSNPATGAQGRMAFMAYVNNGDAPTEVEFQYYRSVSSHTATQMGDQVYIYKLNKNSGWSVTVREGGLKQIVEGTGISVSYSSNKITVNTNIATATTSADGLMSSTDKNNLDELYTFFSTTGLGVDSSGYITQTI